MASQYAHTYSFHAATLFKLAIRQQHHAVHGRPDLVEFWISRISGVLPMLHELTARYPGTVGRAGLAEAIGMTASGGTFGTYLSRLSAAGLIEKGRGGVRAAPTLMERA